MQIDTRRLRKRCKEMPALGKEIARGLWYQDNGASILGIAHLDYVPQTSHFSTVRIMPGGQRIIYSGQLDNRLGVYTLLDVLPVLGVSLDVLLTTDEEKCSSTAWQFATNKVYRWAFSFDRAGTNDVALYQYMDTQTSEAVRRVGLNPAHGSYSDIVELESLGCKCFNWCNGLQEGHSPTAHINEWDYIGCVAKFMEFWNIYSGTHFPHSPVEKWYKTPDKRESVYQWPEDCCEWCGEYTPQLQYLDGAWVCAKCAEHDSWLDECFLCGRVRVVEYSKIYDAWLCEECQRMLEKGD